MKNKTTAGLLALFLGGIGVHRFYLGQTGIGFVYLLFFWTGIPLIISFVEMIIFFTQDEQAFNDKFNRNSSLSGVNAADELAKLHKLKEKGVISETEFDKKKAQLLR